MGDFGLPNLGLALGRTLAWQTVNRWI